MLELGEALVALHEANLAAQTAKHAPARRGGEAVNRALSLAASAVSSPRWMARGR